MPLEPREMFILHFTRFYSDSYMFYANLDQWIFSWLIENNITFWGRLIQFGYSVESAFPSIVHILLIEHLSAFADEPKLNSLIHFVSLIGTRVQSDSFWSISMICIMSPSPSQLAKYGKYGTTNWESVWGNEIKYAPIHCGLCKSCGRFKTWLVAFIFEIEALDFSQIGFIFR